MKSLKSYLKRIIFRLRADFTTEDLIDRGLVVGKNFVRMHDTIIDPSHCWLIHIGDDVTLAPRVHILAHDASTFHHLGYTRIGNVDIGNKVFVGANTVILPNVKIGDNVIIGANSTVSRDIPTGMVAAGCPAKVICTTDEYIQCNKELMKSRPVYGEDFTLGGGISSHIKNKQYEDLKTGIGFIK